MAKMTKSLVFPSSFDSTRYTALHTKDDHPNLAQAQAEAVTTLLLGRPLGLNNTYAFDSRSVLSLVKETLEAGDAVRETANRAGRERIDNTSPFKVYWYAPTEKEKNFFDCCAEQLLRLESPGRLVLSHWSKIGGSDRARKDLAKELTAENPRFPDSVKELDHSDSQSAGELEQSFETLLKLNEYCQGRPDRGDATGKSHIDLLHYVLDFEGLDMNELEQVMDGKIDIDTVMHLRESISAQPRGIKGARSWAHQKVEDAGGEYECPKFLLLQRQLIDTLYNGVLADSVGSNHSLLSSVPRAVGNDRLEAVNAFALNLIRFSKQRRRKELAAADGTEVPSSFDPATDMSEVFVAASAEPDLPASPVRALLVAYWQLIAEDDKWLAWRESCDYLEDSLDRALLLRADGRADLRLTEAWQAHLDMLQSQLPHVKAYEDQLVTSIELSGKDYFTLTGFREQSMPEDMQAGSLAAGEYIDRYLRNVITDRRQ
jgi:hypothetical protein